MIRVGLAAPRRAVGLTGLVLGAAFIRALLLPLGDFLSTLVFGGCLLAIAWVERTAPAVPSAAHGGEKAGRAWSLGAGLLVGAVLLAPLASGSLSGLMKQLGPQFKLDPQMSFETATGTKRNVVTIQGSKFTVELFRLSDDPHDQERFQRRQSVKLPDSEAFLPTVEDVIITKLRWAMQAKRNKDIDDVHDVIAVQANRIEWDYVYKWCDVHGTRSLLDQIRASIPEI